jgi:hypothetical protein
MAKISKESASGISEEERRINLAKVGFNLRRSKQTGEFYIIKKRQAKKNKK